MDTLVSMEWDLYGSRVFSELEETVVWLDIETRKVEAPKTWSQKLRWQPFMVAICGASDPGIFFLDVVAGDEADLIDYLSVTLDGYDVRYRATREFDEMVLRGRFTNARRAHSVRAGRWPNLDLETREGRIGWKNIRKELRPKTWKRGVDCASKDVPKLWEAGEREVVTRHCARDVLELALMDKEAELSDRLTKKLVRMIER